MGQAAGQHSRILPHLCSFHRDQPPRMAQTPGGGPDVKVTKNIGLVAMDEASDQGLNARDLRSGMTT